MFKEIERIRENLDDLYGEVLYGTTVEEVEKGLEEALIDLKNWLKDYKQGSET
jgi:hypothetical protein